MPVSLVILAFLLFLTFGFLPFFLFLAFHILAQLLLVPALFFPLLFGGTEMPAAIALLVTPIYDVLLVTIPVYPFYLMPAETRRESPAIHKHPGTMAAGRPAPSAVTIEVVVVLHVEEIIGQTHRNVKTERLGVNELYVLLNLDLLHRRLIHRFTDDYLPGLFAKVDVHIYSDVSGVRNRNAKHEDGDKLPFDELFHDDPLFLLILLSYRNVALRGSTAGANTCFSKKGIKKPGCRISSDISATRLSR